MKSIFKLVQITFLMLASVCQGAHLGTLYEQVTDPSNSVVPGVRLTGSGTIANNQVLPLNAQATACSTCTPFYYWSAPTGRFEGIANSPNVTWIPPIVNASQTFNIQVTVGDGKGRIASAVLPVTVSPTINACLDGVTVPKLYEMGGWSEANFLPIEWQTIGNATGYVLQEATNSGFSSVSEYTTSGYASASKILYNKSNGTYYYRVKARNDCGDSGWSNTSARVVKVNAPPNIPSGPTPADGAVGIGRTPTLAWNGGDADGQVEYVIKFGTDPNNLWFVQGYGTPNSFNTTKLIDWSLNPATTYYWRIRAQDDRGLETDGPIWSFTTAPSTSPADLVPISATVTGTIANGNTVTMNVVVKNQGDLASDGGILRFYYSPYENGRDVEFSGKQRGIPALPPGASTTISTVLPISGLLAGGSYLVANIDTYLMLTERDVSNNAISYPINTVDTQAPVISSFSFPNAVNGVLKTYGEANFYYTVQDNIAASSVDLSYSSDNGTSWTAITSNYPVTTGSGNRYAWTLPGTVALNNQFKVKVSARDSSGNVGSSILGPYTVIDGSKPTAGVTSPAAGDVWNLGSAHAVTWNATSPNGIKQVRVSYRYANGSASQTVATVTGNPGTYSWTLPTASNYASTSAQIVLDVTDNNDNTSQISSGYFTVRDAAAPPAVPWTAGSNVTTVPTVSTLHTSQNNGSPAVAVDSSGNVHMAYVYVEDNLANLFADVNSYPARITTNKLYYTKKTGSIWSMPVLIRSIVDNLDGDALGAKSFSNVKIAVGSNGRPSLVWVENISNVNNLSEVYFSSFNGSSWSAPFNVSDDSKRMSFTWSTPAQPPNPSGGGGVRLTYIANDIYATGIGTSNALYKYSTLANTWTQMANISGVTSSGSSGGDICAVGGLVYAVDSAGAFVSYNPATNTWTQKAPLLTVGAGVRLVAFTGAGAGNGKIYAVGAGVSNTLQMFNPDTNAWTYKAAMPTARTQPVITPFENKLHVIGGINAAGQGLNTVEEYDPATDTWISKPPTNQLRYVNGAAYVAGRNYVSASDHAYMEAYDGNDNLWEPAGPLPVRMGNGDMVAPYDGNLYALNDTFFGRGTPTGTTDINARISEAPILVVDSSNVAHVYWYQYATYNVDGAALRSFTNATIPHRSFDPGTATWSAKDFIISGDQGQRGFVTAVSGATTHMVYAQYSAALGRTAINYMTNSGSGWSAPTLAVIEDVGAIQTIDMRVDGQGNPMLLVMTKDSQVKPYRLFYTSLKNGAWSAPETVFRDTVLLSPSRLFVDTSNVPVVLFQNSSNQNVYLTKRLDDGRWVNGVIGNSASQSVTSFDAAVDPTTNKLFAAYSANLNGHDEIFTSLADLTIDFSSPDIALTAPPSGTVLIGGSTQELSWTASDDRAVASVTLKYSTDGGTTFTSIASGLGASGTYLWTVPNVSTSALVVYAVAIDAAGNQGTAFSGALSVTPRTLISVGISGPGVVDEGTSASFALVANYNNATSSTVAGTMSLVQTSFASLSGMTLTANQVAANQTVTLNASFTEAGVTKTASVQVMIRDTAVAPIGYTLNVVAAGAGAGTVTSNPTGINCGATCSASFASGTSVTLNAAPTAGNTFSGWSGDCTGTGSCVVTMGASKNVTATFVVTPNAPVVSLNPTSLTFTSQNVGTTSTQKTVTLTNTGNAPLTISSIVRNNSVFNLTNNCGSTVVAGANCNFGVSYTPTSAVNTVSSVTVTSNAAGSPHTVVLNGTGVPAGAPICTLTANPTRVAANGTAVLTSSCTNSPTSYSWTGGTCAGTTATTCTVTPATTTTYTVTANNAAGSNAASATVTVGNPGADLIPILFLLLLN